LEILTEENKLEALKVYVRMMFKRVTGQVAVRLGSCTMGLCGDGYGTR